MKAVSKSDPKESMGTPAAVSVAGDSQAGAEDTTSMATDGSRTTGRAVRARVARAIAWDATGAKARAVVARSGATRPRRRTRERTVIDRRHSILSESED